LLEPNEAGCGVDLEAPPSAVWFHAQIDTGEAEPETFASSAQRCSMLSGSAAAVIAVVAPATGVRDQLIACGQKYANAVAVGP